MTDKASTPITRKPKGRALKFWRLVKLREIFRSDSAVAQPGKRTGTRQRKIRWGRADQKAAKRSNETARRRAKRAMTKVMQRRRKAKGRDVRHG